MKGENLFNQYTSKRDYSGSNADEYAQLLITIKNQIGNSVYAILEKAESIGKKLNIKDLTAENTILCNEFTNEDIILL